MVDLMNGPKKEFDAFVTKYNNFVVPCCRIIIGNSEFTEDNIGDIQIDINVKDAAGTCRFTIRNCFSYEENRFSSEIKSKLILGKYVSVLLGYCGVIQVIFVGYVESINYELGDSPHISVGCMDGIHVLMQNTVEEQKDKTKNLSDMVTEILKRSRHILELEVETIAPIEVQMVQKESDYEFIKRIANENGFEFFILAGTAYFRKAKNVKTLITSLKLGQNIISFSSEVKYKNVKVTVRGMDELKKLQVTGVATGITNTDYIEESFISNKIIQEGKCETDDKAKKRADIEVKNILESSYSVKLSCIGIPELVPGRYIELENFDDEFNKKYYITQATHSFSAGGYQVSLSLRIG